MGIVRKYSLSRAGGQGLKQTNGTPGRFRPLVSHVEMLPFVQFLYGSRMVGAADATLCLIRAPWRSNLGSCGVLGCPVGTVGGRFRTAKWNSRVTKPNFGLLRWEIFDHSFHRTSLRSIPPYQNSFQHTSLHPILLHLQK